MFCLKEITPSPLAMLAQTCSRIGSDGATVQSNSVQEVGSITASGTYVATSSTSTTACPSLVTINSNGAVSSAQNNTITISQDGNMVIPNVTLLPQMQNINFGGQEVLFIPAQNSTDAGQSTTLQLGGQSTKPVQLGGQNAIPIQPLSQGNPIVVQANGQTVQQVPSFIQIPVSTANGQTIYQTIQIGTVPIPVAATPVTASLLPTSTTSQSEGIIAAALADSQVQLKPSKKSQSQQNQKASKAGGDMAMQATQLVQTSSGYMLMSSAAMNESADSLSKLVGSTVTSSPAVSSSPGKQLDYTTLVSVEAVPSGNNATASMGSAQVSTFAQLYSSSLLLQMYFIYNVIHNP